MGDLFFHLIPESFHSHMTELESSAEPAYRSVGLSIISGVFMFIIVEMMLEKWSQTDSPSSTAITDHESESSAARKSKSPVSQVASIVSKPNDQDLKQTKLIDDDLNVFANNNNNNNNDHDDCYNDTFELIENNNIAHNPNFETDYRQKCNPTVRDIPVENHICELKKDDPGRSKIDSSGYLSLIANGFDNFTHGLAIGASFLVGMKVGLLTTFVIIIHEIPHEICDYAILVNSGFSRLDAVKAQSSVSLFTIIGTASALWAKSVQSLNESTKWILPFSAGGFLYIALVSLLPEILDRKTDFRSSVAQIACVILGIAFMGAVALI